MVVMAVNMMVMVMGARVRLCSFGGALRVGSFSAVGVLLIVDMTPVLLPTSPSRFGAFNLSNCRTHEVAALDMCRRTHSRWCSCPICGLTGSWSRGPNPAAETREHATEFHLDPRVVSARTDMSRLCPLNSLR